MFNVSPYMQQEVDLEVNSNNCNVWRNAAQIYPAQSDNTPLGVFYWLKLTLWLHLVWDTIHSNRVESSLFLAQWYYLWFGLDSIHPMNLSL
jgi:hypothetical protein